MGVVLLVLLQLGIIKFETPKMYERHFKIVHEPPPYVEETANGAVASVDIVQEDNCVVSDDVTNVKDAENLVLKDIENVNNNTNND